MDEIVELLVETVSVKREHIRISGAVVTIIRCIMVGFGQIVLKSCK